MLGFLPVLFIFQVMTPQRTLLLHFHGGGFVAMTAQAHESYLRLWAQDTGCTIVSVDYSRAPEAPFPKGLYECFDAFVWACSMVQSPGG